MTLDEGDNEARSLSFVVWIEWTPLNTELGLCMVA